MNNDQNTNIQELKDLLRNFRDARDWQQYHHPKDLAAALSIEAGELLEHFLWKDKEAIAKRLSEDQAFKQEVGHELADVLIYCLHFANAADLDVATIIKDKMLKNGEKYPVEKAKGRAEKYTSYQS